VAQHIPLARYFLYVGGAMLTLLLIVDAILPKIPVAHQQVQTFLIRIHSDRKWPDRVVYDTNLSTSVPARIAGAEADVPALSTAADDSAAAREREAFAQMHPTAPNQLRPSAPKEREPTLHRGRKIVTKKRVAPPQVLVARQPPFGWFGTRIW
jgi:hypothetical protein